MYNGSEQHTPITRFLGSTQLNGVLICLHRRRGMLCPGELLDENYITMCNEMESDSYQCVVNCFENESKKRAVRLAFVVKVNGKLKYRSNTICVNCHGMGFVKKVVKYNTNVWILAILYRLTLVTVLITWEMSFSRSRICNKGDPTSPYPPHKCNRYSLEWMDTQFYRVFCEGRNCLPMTRFKLIIISKKWKRLWPLTPLHEIHRFWLHVL